MEHKHKLILIIGLPSLTFFTILVFAIICTRRGRRRRKERSCTRDIEAAFECKEVDGVANTEDLIKFQGGKDLIVQEILDAPGEVIGKSSYGTLYRASLVNSNTPTLLLRFLRPTCTLRMKEVVPIVESLGSVRHPNLVPLNAIYAGSRGEKLMVHPFYGSGNLAQFIRDSNVEAHKWPIVSRIARGITRGIHHLHTSSEKPIIHGNLKSKNILLDSHYQPYISDFGLYNLLNPNAAQQMLEASAFQGYKAPELIKMKDVCQESDIYSFGVILLQLLTGKEPVDDNPNPDQDFYLPSAMRSAILDDRIMELYHPDFLLGLSNDQRVVVEHCILGFFSTRNGLLFALASPPTGHKGSPQQARRNLAVRTQQCWFCPRNSIWSWF